MHKSKDKGNALINIINLGLIFWVKKQCKAIEEIEIKIEGLNLGLKSSKISKVIFSASNINYKNI